MTNAIWRRLVSVPFSRNSRPAKPAPISHCSDRWRTPSAGLEQIVTEPSSDWCQSHPAETPDQQKLPRSRTVRIRGGPFSKDSPPTKPAPISHCSDLWRTAFAGLKQIVTEPSSDWCQSHLAETPVQQNLPQCRTARIGGGPLLRDSNKSSLSLLCVTC